MKNVKEGDSNVMSKFTFNILGHLGSAVQKEENKLEVNAAAVAS